MICKKCNNQMYLDDKDFRFKGNYDNYWNCPNCETSCIRKIRFGQIYEDNWHSENDNKVEDWINKYKIDTNRR